LCSQAQWQEFEVELIDQPLLMMAGSRADSVRVRIAFVGLPPHCQTRERQARFGEPSRAS
jgi:hypothetical protein